MSILMIQIDSETGIDGIFVEMSEPCEQQEDFNNSV
jgi:hypothetical protein